jgi:TonB family protein
MIEPTTLTVAAEQASPADAIPLDPPEPIAPTGWRPGRRATEIGLLLAILLHLLVLTVAIAPVEWWRRKPPPQPIPVTIVMEEPKPPPPPPPEAKPEPPPPPAPPAPAVPYAESGPDQVTRPAAPSEKPPTAEAPPPAPEPAPAPEPNPATEPPPTPAPEPKPTPTPPAPLPETETAALPVPPPLPPAAKPTPPQPVPRPASKPKPAPKAPPTRGPTSPNASGKDMTGDIYLNRMRDMIGRWLRFPRGVPRPVRPVIYGVVVGHDGQILDLQLASSSGQAFFDMVAEEAIRRAAPYPPPPFLPAGVAGININVTVPPP